MSSYRSAARPVGSRECAACRGRGIASERPFRVYSEAGARRRTLRRLRPVDGFALLLASSDEAVWPSTRPRSCRRRACRLEPRPQPDVARPFRIVHRSQKTAWSPFGAPIVAHSTVPPRHSQVSLGCPLVCSARSGPPGGELIPMCRETYAISSSWWTTTPVHQLPLAAAPTRSALPLSLAHGPQHSDGLDENLRRDQRRRRARIRPD